MLPAPERFQIDSVDFEVPCRRFTVRATITRDRQLPVVDEFLLRLLAVLDRMPIRRLRTWFGFTESEIQIVLVELERRGHIEIDGDDVLLAPAGRDLFRAVTDGGVPRLVEVVPLIDNVWFDLVSRNMVPRSRARSVGYLVRLKEQPSARDLPESFAREAFETHFRDYVRRVKRMPDADSVNIYAVSDIEAGTYSYQTVRARVELDPFRSALRLRFPLLEEESVRFRELTMLATDIWQNLVQPAGELSAITEYEKFTGDQSLVSFFQGAQDADGWRDLLATPPTDVFARTIGAAYLEKNASALVDKIGRAALSPNSKLEIIWLRHAGVAWARTQLAAATIQSVRDALRQAGASEVSTTLVVPRSTPRQNRKDHRKLFDRGLLLPQGHVSPSIEVLIVKGVGALVNVCLNSGGHPVPVGCFVTDEKLLGRLYDRLTPGNSEWEGLWSTKPGFSESPPE